MDDHFNNHQSCDTIQRLPQSLPSLLGLNRHLTPSWIESVSSIIEELSSVKRIVPLQRKTAVHPSFDDATEDDSIAKVNGEIASLNVQLKQLTKERRQALADYLDAKGNIRVFCRIRPPLPEDKVTLLRSPYTVDSSNVLLKVANDKIKQYRFDRVFNTNSTQEQLYAEVDPVIQSALYGYNVCVFAYGQTGSGKTYTMEGRSDDPGVMPRAIQWLFCRATESCHNFRITFSMLEIYMGQLRDLLVPDIAKGGGGSGVHQRPGCLTVQVNPEGGVEIENLLAFEVSDMKQVKQLYESGTRVRSTASTEANSKSSRSHCMVCITLSCDVEERIRAVNKVWMIDLGGSERLSKTQASGRRLEEGKAINLSLSALGDVIDALQCRRSHVPFRNSKLTQVLQDSLGYDSKTLMLVHVSPNENDLCETICSLGFAMRVSSVHLACEREETLVAIAPKDTLLAEMLQKIDQLELQCQDVERRICVLQDTVQRLRGTLSVADALSDHASLLNSEGPQQTGLLIKGTGEHPAPPSFMRPTASSQRKTSPFCRQRLPIIQPKKRRASSVYTESVGSDRHGRTCQSEFSIEQSVSVDSDVNSAKSESSSQYETKKVLFSGCETSPVTSSGDQVEMPTLMDADGFREDAAAMIFRYGSPVQTVKSRIHLNTEYKEGNGTVVPETQSATPAYKRFPESCGRFTIEGASKRLFGIVEQLKNRSKLGQEVIFGEESQLMSPSCNSRNEIGKLATTLQFAQRLCIAVLVGTGLWRLELANEFFGALIR